MVESNISQFDLINRKNIIKLLYKSIEEIKYLSVNELERVLNEYPILSKIYNLVYSFKSVLFSQAPNELDLWIENAK